MERDRNGKFIEGHMGGPGRPKRRIETAYLDIIISRVPFPQWAKIIDRAVRDAQRGDARARQFLADYLIGKPPQVMELRGQDALLLADVLDQLTARGYSASEIFEAMLASLAETDSTNGR